MPRRNDIHKILILGSGPIVIGQAAEFDYSGVQACKVLREEGYEIVLVNSNPATIMTDPEFADATYVEPLLPGPVTQIIEKERPDALLPTLGGQTALNLAKALSEDGTLEKFGVELIGANYDAINTRRGPRALPAGDGRGRAEDAGQRDRDDDRGSRGGARAHRPARDRAPRLHARRPRRRHRPHRGGATRTIVARGLAASPITQVLVDQSVHRLGRVRAGGHARPQRQRGDRLLDREPRPDGRAHRRQRHGRPAADADRPPLQASCATRPSPCIRAVGVETGGSNVQFAVNPSTEEILVIEMNPRVSRSSALASKATGFPIAKIAARLAVGYSLEEIPNDITRVTPASFEPTIDYVVVKWPRFAFEKFSGANAELSTHMKSVGEAMAIGRTFSQAFLKAMRSRELDAPPRLDALERGDLLTMLDRPASDRFDVILAAFRQRGHDRGDRRQDVHRPVVPARAPGGRARSRRAV